MIQTPPPYFAAVASALLLAASLTACGGGGGDSTTGSSAVSASTNAASGATGGVNAAVVPAGSASLAVASAPLKVTEVKTGLANPWSLAFLPDGRMLVTQRGGSLLLLSADGQTSSPVAGVPVVETAGQGGLFDVALDPAFATNQRVYLSFAERDSTNAALNGTAVARADLDTAALTLSNVTVIFRQTPKVQSTGHFGSRLVFDTGGYLWVTTGDRQLDSERGYAQDLARGNGKVMRITTSGAPAPGNPSFMTMGAQAGIWSYGHRNVQGAARHPATGELWTNEHGPQGGDEVNRTLAGRNYGWPLVSYGQEYGTLTPVGMLSMAGTEQPLSYWETIDGSPWTGGQKSSIAPSGMAFYTGDAIAEWKGNLFVGALAGTALWRLVLDGNTVVSRERLYAARNERIRDVRQGPDGWLYLLTDSTNGKLLRIAR
jgi:aldose sugar dehydrogenase